MQLSMLLELSIHMSSTVSYFIRNIMQLIRLIPYSSTPGHPVDRTFSGCMTKAQHQQAVGTEDDTTQALVSFVHRTSNIAAMTYKWRLYKDICHRLYVEEKVPTSDILDYLAREYNLRPR